MVIKQREILGNQSWIDMLKFKISYGLQGNDNLMFQGGLYRNYYPYQDQYTLANSNGDFQLLYIIKVIRKLLGKLHTALILDLISLLGW